MDSQWVEYLTEVNLFFLLTFFVYENEFFLISSREICFE